jgi:hypothetical protein
MEDHESFAAGKRAPVRIGFGEVTFDEAVLALIFDNEWEVSCRGGFIGRRTREWAEERGKRVLVHGFEKHASIVHESEFG